eukprot:Em0020g232a
MGSNLKTLSGEEIPDYKTCLAAMRCSPATTECFLGNCNESPGSVKLRETILNIMDANLIDTVEFRQWTTTDHANLEMKVLPIDDFVDSFIVGLEKLQNEIQSYHWNSTQTTIHPSDHSTAAVHLLQWKLIIFLIAQSGKLPSKVMYLSDGCAAQYKNCKNFNNLCHRIDNLAEWHFFATLHGKTAGDGAAGTFKRLAAKSSLQRPYTE